MTFIVFTNNIGIRNLSPELANNLNGFCENNNDIAVYDKVGVVHLIDVSQPLLNPLTDTASVILISDTREIPNEIIGITNKVNQLIGNETDIYIIYHDSDRFSYLNRHKAGMAGCFCLKIKGELVSHHSLNTAHHKLFQCLAPFNFSQLERLISLFPDPILEAKLELLHKCLLPSDAPLTIVDFNADFAILKDFESNYNSFLKAKKSLKKKGTNENYEATDSDVYNPDYIEAVKQLRIALLGS